MTLLRRLHLRLRFLSHNVLAHDGSTGTYVKGSFLIRAAGTVISTAAVSVILPVVSEPLITPPMPRPWFRLLLPLLLLLLLRRGARS